MNPMKFSERQKIIHRKLSLLNAQKVMGQFLELDFIEFEDENSSWVKKFETILKQFRTIGSIPVYTRHFGDKTDNYIAWIQRGLDFLKDQKEWMIVVPNCNESVWVSVRIKDFHAAIAELWKISENNEFVVADKITSQIAAVFSEENCYEIHIDDGQI